MDPKHETVTVIAGEAEVSCPRKFSPNGLLATPMFQIVLKPACSPCLGFRVKGLGLRVCAGFEAVEGPIWILTLSLEATIGKCFVHNPRRQSINSLYVREVKISKPLSPRGVKEPREDPVYELLIIEP